MGINQCYSQEKLFKALHKIALEFKELSSEKEVCIKTVESAESLLNFNICHVSLAKNDRFIPIASSKEMDANPIPLDKGIAGKTLIENKSFLINDAHNNPNAEPTELDYRSGISIPIKSIGIFQAISNEKNAFNKNDLELAEILISHTTSALNRIYAEQKIKDNNLLLNSILESIQDGITVINPDMTIRYTNSKIKSWYSNSFSLSGKKCYEVFQGANEKCNNCPVIRSIDSGEVESEVMPGKSGTGLDFLEVYSYPIKDKDTEEVTGVVEFVRDITDRVNQKKLLEMNKFFVDNSDLLILRVTPEGKIAYANNAMLDKLEYNSDELEEKYVDKIVPEDDYIKRDEFWKKIKESDSITYEKDLIASNGRRIPTEITSQYFNYREEEYEFVFAKDITEEKEKERELKYLLYRDKLTGLYNRRFFEEEMDRLDTERQIPISLIMADVNGLKLINDSYGHKEGDRLLIKAANIFIESVRSEDILARWAGDEFVILLPQTSRRDARIIVDRIKSKCRVSEADGIPVSIALGAATKTKSTEELKDILKIADDTMYKNKLAESKESKNRMIKCLLNNLEAKSSETETHAMRMTRLAFDFGNELNLSISEMDRLSLLATLHDIGKTTITEKILNKPEKLTLKEWEIMKKHSERGYKIAAASEEFAIVAKEILSHHEHWDGRGYPRGLKEENIPYLARIISIIDAYEVMINDRPYHKAITKEAALTELKDKAGTQFDPELVNKFMDIL